MESLLSLTQLTGHCKENPERRGDGHEGVLLGVAGREITGYCPLSESYSSCRRGKGSVLGPSLDTWAGGGVEQVWT
jgi:hypothetical protein